MSSEKTVIIQESQKKKRGLMVLKGESLNMLRLPFLKLLESDDVSSLQIDPVQKFCVVMASDWQGKHGDGYWRIRSLQKSLGDDWRIEVLREED